MSEADTLVKQAVAAYKAGRKEEARDLLLEAVDRDERNEQAWLWLSATVDSLEEQQICLENVLSINPSNDRARKGLDTVMQKIAAQQGANPSPPPPAAKPAAGPGPIGAEFAAVSGDQLVGGPTAASAFFGEESGLPLDPFAPPTSVEWDRSEGTSAYGSGKQVELPTDQEYEDWMRSLNLGGASSGTPAASTTSPFLADDAAPFGDTSFMVDSEPFGAAAPASPAPPSDPFGGDPFGSDPFGGGSWDAVSPFAEEPEQPGSASSERAALLFGSQPESDFGSSATPAFADFTFEESLPPPPTPAPSAAPSPTFGGSFVFDEDVPASHNPFDFDAEDEDDEFGPVWGAGTPAPAAPAASSIRPEEYFRYIPADIEPITGGGARSYLLLGGAVLLVVLDVAALGVLLAGI